MENNTNQNETNIETNATEAGEVNVEKQEPVQENKFTQEDINRILAKEKKKWNKEKSEAERLAALSADERAKAELEIEKAKIAEERAELNRLKMVNQTQKELTALDLPSDFAEFLVSDDADTTKERITSFKKLWDKHMEIGVSNRLKGTAPVTQTTEGKHENPVMTKEEFRKLKLFEQNEIYIRDPELYKKLTEK